MPRIHDIDVSRLTRLGQLIDAYAQRQRPRLSTISAIASAIGVRPNTAKSLLYSEHEPSPRTLRKVIERTGIPAATIYAAITPALPAPLAPPVPRDLRERQQPPRLVEGDAPYAALTDFLRRVQSFHLDEEQRRALIDSVVAAVAPPAERHYWQQRIAEEHDHDHIKTLEMPTVPTQPPTHTVTTAEPQADSQPVGTHS